MQCMTKTIGSFYALLLILFIHLANCKLVCAQSMQSLHVNSQLYVHASELDQHSEPNGPFLA